MSTLVRWTRLTWLACAGLLSPSATAGCAPAYSCRDTMALLSAGPPRLSFDLVATLPHDPDSFTEGLVFEGDRLFESVGREGRSALLELSPATGQILRRVPWPDYLAGSSEKPFAEGLAAAHGRLVQLSWKNGRALTWGTADLVRGVDLPYSGQGWGLAFDGQVLWRSDGTQKLHRHDAHTFAEIGEPLAVHAGRRPVRYINELEWASGAFLANVWQTPLIIRIDPGTGVVTGLLDLQKLVDEVHASGSESVLNGVAVQPSTGHLFVTGKHWRKMFVVALHEKAQR